VSMATEAAPVRPVLTQGQYEGCCGRCGVGFVAATKRRRYCSPSCAHQAWIEARRDRYNARMRAWRNRKMVEAGRPSLGRSRRGILHGPRPVLGAGECERCGAGFPIKQIARGVSVRRFCSRRCANKAWRERNSERSRELARAKYRRDPAKARLAIRRYYLANREKVDQKAKEWRQRNRDRVRFYSRLRHARARAAGPGCTYEEWMVLVARFAHRCAYCGGPGGLTLDHRVPLSKGGANGISNFLPACADCNRRKNALDEALFRARLATAHRYLKAEGHASR
jgi:5-methylcytosine-specific restriction endonuclease McrA